jgi:hypothetical protein
MHGVGRIRLERVHQLIFDVPTAFKTRSRVIRCLGVRRAAGEVDWLALVLVAEHHESMKPALCVSRTSLAGLARVIDGGVAEGGRLSCLYVARVSHEAYRPHACCYWRWSIGRGRWGGHPSCV